MLANKTQHFLQDHDVKLWDNDIWPGNLSDLNVAEHIGSIIKDKVEKQSSLKLDIIDILKRHSKCTWQLCQLTRKKIWNYLKLFYVHIQIKAQRFQKKQNREPDFQDSNTPDRERNRKEKTVGTGTETARTALFLSITRVIYVL